MQQMDRKEFIVKSCRWVAGAGALYLAGNLISCSDAQDSKSVSENSSSTSGSEDTTSSDDSRASSGGDSTTSGENSGSGSVAVVVSGKCIGCGKCARGICPKDAISIIGDLAVIGAACDGCGKCVSYCPRNAIQLSSGMSSAPGSAGSTALAAPGRKVVAA